jgi:molybdopterin converting factor small subunit
MGTVKVEIWSWPAAPRAKLSDVKKRITLEEKIRPGMSALDLFNGLAESDASFRDFIFDRVTQEFHFHVSVVFNERVINMPELSKTLLKDGDKIIIIPGVAGG